MLGFITGNLATIIIGLMLLGVIVLAVRSIRRDKKAGRSCGSCPGGCKGCSGASICHADKKVR